ncbi:reverse transcriptase domain-containing protein [Tanacetum coccineum]
MIVRRTSRVTSVKLMLFPFSLEEAARIWLDKEPPRSILTWDDLVSKFINKLFPHSKTTNLRNEITRFQQRFDESFYEAWDRFNDLLKACPHHGFSELHQLDTLIMPLNTNVKIHLIRRGGAKPASSIEKLRLLRIKAESDLKESPPGSVLHIKSAIPSTSSSPPKVMNRDTEVTKDTMLPTNNGSTEDIQPPVVQVQSQNSTSEPVVDPVSAPKPNQQTSIPFPSRRNDERRREKANDQVEKFYEIFRDLSFEISFTDALTLMPKFASTLKTLLGNKEKLSEMARTPLNENCSAVILNKLPKKLGDPGRFLIPCEFSGINTCNALADLGASINLMPYSVWKDLSLPELTPTCMTLELADRSITEPIGIAKDVRLMVGKFQFPADFVVVDFEPDPRVPLILGRSFLKTSRALIDVYEGEITLRVGKEAITFNLDQTSRYTANYNHMTANRIDVIELASEEYSQEVLGFSDSVAYGNPSPDYDPIVSNSSPTLTPFGDSDFLLLEEANAFIAINDEPISWEIDATYYDPEGDILILEALLNSEPLPPLPNHKDYSPGIRKELKVVEAKTVKSSIDEPPEDEEKAALIKVLKSPRSHRLENSPDITGVDQSFVLTKDPYGRGLTTNSRVKDGLNPKIHDVIKKGMNNL